MRAASLGYEGWYHSLSKKLHACLSQRKLYSHLAAVFAFVFLLQRRAPCPCSSWLWSLAGCLVMAQCVHSMARIQRGRDTTGEQKCKPQVPDMNIPDDSVERPHYCHGRYCENKGTILRMESYVLLINYFLITALSWSERYSMLLRGLSSSRQLLLIRGVSTTSSFAHKTPLFEL